MKLPNYKSMHQIRNSGQNRGAIIDLIWKYWEIKISTIMTYNV